MRSFVLLFLLASAAFAADQSLTADELVARHLASLGTPQARAAAKDLAVGGPVRFQFIAGGGGQSQGTARLGTEGRKLRFQMTLSSPNYLGEDFVSDGAKADVNGFLSGQRSILGTFFYPRRDLIKEGLFGGVLSTGWALLNLDTLNPKLRYEGLKKIAGKELHELRYQPRKGFGDLTISLYFDPQTYRHVMTVYELVRPITGAGPASPGRAATATESGQALNTGGTSAQGRQTLRETFAAFKQLDGVVIPTQWSIELINDFDDTSQMRWDIAIQQASHASIDPAAFKVR